VDLLLEELHAAVARAEEVQKSLVYAALTFAEVPQEQWSEWRVSLGSPTVIRRVPKAESPQVEEEVAADE
jgi:hypothetical protein